MKIDNKAEKSFAKAFYHQINRVLPSFIFNKSHVEKSLVGEIAAEKITDDLIYESIEFVKKCNNEFIKESKTKQISSVAKSGKFDDFLSTFLIKKYN